ncbi:prenyltransferase/squalene oxidase repeat-containing protein [uncultured Draconibacterium sp.]|uniref:prenyltransferase/squalene oxidase repeat-containing protein n=1 Tax=uncultured Draconibacterium sp. TaxID=1573823 RepID=UPI0032174082
MKKKLEIRFKELSKILLNELKDEGFWTGQLSSSALGVSVAVAALYFYDANENQAEVSKGFTWLKNNINADGSFGDTPESPGNISTSLLVYAALNLYSDQDKSLKELQTNIADYLQKNGIDINSDQVAKTILAHYKTDYTFSVPILTMSALCGIPAKNGFKKIPQLPFELALLPQKFYRLLNLSVVSYAIPALIAVGIVIFKKKKSGKFAKWIRKGAERKTLKILQKSMPQSGGFLEAIPLTAFVALSLINAGYKDLDVVKKGIQFLKQTQRDDGGWPIDVDLSTWVTTLSIKALGPRKDTVLNIEQKNALTKHLKTIQNKSVHPFNGTSPGGWGWTNYSGSVPDADDTPGAILALLELQAPNEIKDEVLDGANWLIKLQNTDGGFPTFSKGWGKLPFDQSCSDLTGHCFLALAKVLDTFNADLSLPQQKKLNRSLLKAAAFLQKQQKDNGSWLPLWFGNQHTSTHENPVYGTARVLTYLNDSLPCLSFNSELKVTIKTQISKGENFLIDVQNRDGSWGGDKNIPGTIEETALSVSALSNKNFEDACKRGLNWLDQSYQTSGLKAAPIGLYFASLWYDEKMYPLTAYLEAVTRSLKS